MKMCPKCNETHTKSGVFCSRSCANSRGPRTEDFKEKVRKKLKGKSFPHLKRSIPRPDYYNIKRAKCSNCKKDFWSYRPKNGNGYKPYCSDKCYLEIKKKNATGIKRKNYNGKLFDSQWEVELAKYLDSKNINWIQPVKPIIWQDYTNKKRKYFPDFYLTDLDIYLDPKNPYCIKQQKEKLECVTKLISLVYGNVNEIIEYLENHKIGAGG